MRPNRSTGNYSGALIHHSVANRLKQGLIASIIFLGIALLFGSSLILAQDSPSSGSVSVHLVLFASEDWFILYVPPEAAAVSVSLEGLQFFVPIKNKSEIVVTLSDDFPILKNAQSVVSAPSCFIYQANDTNLPGDCDKAVPHIKNKPGTDVFWFDRQGIDVAIYQNGHLAEGVDCPYASASGFGGCDFVWTYELPTPTPTPAPRPTSTPIPLMSGWISLGDHQIQVAPVVKADFIEFIKQGGWNPDEDWWEGDGKDWLLHFTDRQQVPVAANRIEFSTTDPMLGLSWYAAKAYCLSKGWYLPSQQDLTISLPDNIPNPASKEWTGDKDNTGKYIVIDMEQRRPDSSELPDTQGLEIGFRCAAPYGEK